MDMQTPDHASTPFPTSSSGPPSRMFSRHLLKILAATTPGDDDDPTALAENRESTQELFDSLDPRDPADAMLAAIAVAAAQSAMDNFARAARPGMSDETVMRLRSNALAVGRAYATARRPRSLSGQRHRRSPRRSRRLRNRSSSRRKCRPGSSRCDRAPNRSPPCSGRAIASARRSPTGAET